MDNSIHKKLLVTCFIGVLYSLNIFACLYTVREIGFSDIGSVPYTLYIYTKSDMPEKDDSKIKKLSYVLLFETNIKPEIINIDEERDSITQYYLNKYNIHSFPSALFVSPYGESMICSLNYPGRSFDESVWLLLENIASSTIRNSITDMLLSSYCIVLMIEGEDAGKNKNTLHKAKEAISEISGLLDQMPKVVNSQPGIIVISHEKIHDEKILLMSLGIKAEEVVEPAIAIIYGRGRIIGPVLQGEQITQKRLFNLLTIVGADCECGLDQSWILGRMLPMRWESSVQSKLVKFLGFDVENPLVKSEMSQILSVKPKPDDQFDPMTDNLLGYSEGKIIIEKSAESVSKISAYEIRESFYQTKPSKNSIVFRAILITIGGILLIVLAIGVFLFIKHKRKSIKQ